MPLSNAFNNPFLKIFYVIALSNQRLAHFLNARASSKDAFLIELGNLHKQYVMFKLKKIIYIINSEIFIKRNRLFFIAIFASFRDATFLFSAFCTTD